MKRWTMVLFVVVLLTQVAFVITPAAAAEFRYSVTPIAVPFPAGYRNVDPTDINDSRQIVGRVTYDDPNNQSRRAGFFWMPGMGGASLIYPADPNQGNAEAVAINASGQMAANQGILDNKTQVLRTNANFANAQSLGSGYSIYATDINNAGDVVGTDYFSGRRATIWPSSGAPAIRVPQLPGSTSAVLPDWARSINDYAEVTGYAYVQATDPRWHNLYDQKVGFVYTVASGAMYQLHSIADDRYVQVKEINNNRWVVGSCIGIPTNTSVIYSEPAYWDTGGAAHTVRAKIPATFKDGYIDDIDNANNMYISTQYVNDLDAWIYHPDWAEAKNLDDLIPADSGYHVGAALTVSPEGLVIGRGQDASFANVLLLLQPYDVETTPVGAGIGASADMLGGAGVTGGVAAAFGEVTGGGAMVAHYGSESMGDFALQFLADPADMDDVAGMIPDGTAQHWLVDFEGGTYTGLVTLTFCYDDSLLPAGFDETQLVVLHYDDGVWETLVPTSIDTIANTATIQTDFFSPFVLGAVPEPCTAMILTLAATGLLHRRRRRR